MSTSFKTISGTATGEIIEKKSRFIANASHITTQDEAFDYIKEQKKKYWDARHNCSAFVIGHEQSIMHSSDDGEPSGTAGKPMLNVLTGNGLCNIVVVVTRYFGGTLLGTGGLVRAYAAAVEECLKNTVIKEPVFCTQLLIEAGYNDIGKLQNLFASRNISVLSSDYTEKVHFTVLVPANDELSFKNAITDITQAKASFSEIAKDFFDLK